MSSLAQVWLKGFARFSNRVDLFNFGRWLVLALLVGVVAGLGGTLLTWGVEGIGSVLLGDIVGFHAPGHGESATPSWSMPERPWLLLLVLPLAGMLVGWIVQTFAPEAEGHGTDAVINSYHRGRAVLRKRVVPVKLITSMITIGSGGSAGREGPVAQIGAGFGSYLARSVAPGLPRPPDSGDFRGGRGCRRHVSGTPGSRPVCRGGFVLGSGFRV